jgi:hypothetical protein
MQPRRRYKRTWEKKEEEQEKEEGRRPNQLEPCKKRGY